MDLEKILKMLEAGNHFLLIPITTKVTPLQYLAAEDAAKKKGQDLSLYTRNALITQLDRDSREPELLKIDIPQPLPNDLEKERFLRQAYEKFMLANHIDIPTQKELEKLWVDGKKEVAMFGRVTVLVEPALLPKNIS